MALSSRHSSSRLNVWFKDDIQNALRAIDSANAELFSVVNTPELQIYRRGYEAALRAMAEAFGLRYEGASRSRDELPAVIEGPPY